MMTIIVVKISTKCGQEKRKILVQENGQPFDKPFYLIFYVSVIGNYFS